MKTKVFIEDSYLDTLLVVDPADHPYTHLSDLVEGGLLQTNVPQNLDHPLPDTDTSVLEKRNAGILSKKEQRPPANGR